MSGETEIKVLSGRPLPLATLVTKADAVCRRVNTLLDSTNVKTTQEFIRVLPQASVDERAEAIDLAKLVPPPSLRPDWQQIVFDLQKVSEYSMRIAEHIQVARFKGAQGLLTSFRSVKHEMRAISERDHLKQCSQQ